MDKNPPLMVDFYFIDGIIPLDPSRKAGILL
jgi:hypothetical protein